MPPPPASYLPGVLKRAVELHQMKYSWTELGRDAPFFASADVPCVYAFPVGSCCAMRRSCAPGYGSVILSNSRCPHLQSYMLAPLDCLPMSPHLPPPTPAVEAAADRKGESFLATCGAEKRRVDWPSAINRSCFTMPQPPPPPPPSSPSHLPLCLSVYDVRFSAITMCVFSGARGDQH